MNGNVGDHLIGSPKPGLLGRREQRLSFGSIHQHQTLLNMGGLGWTLRPGAGAKGWGPQLGAAWNLFRTSAIVLGEKAKICFGISTASLGSLHKSYLLVITCKSNLITCLKALLQKYLITSKSSTADLLVNVAFHVSNALCPAHNGQQCTTMFLDNPSNAIRFFSLASFGASMHVNDVAFMATSSITR